MTRYDKSLLERLGDLRLKCTNWTMSKHAIPDLQARFSFCRHERVCRHVKLGLNMIAMCSGLLQLSEEAQLHLTRLLAVRHVSNIIFF